MCHMCGGWREDLGGDWNTREVKEEAGQRTG